MERTLGYKNKQKLCMLHLASGQKPQLWTYDFAEDSVAVYAHAALPGLSQGTSGTSVTPWLDTAQSPPGDAQVPRSHHYS